MQNRKNSSLTKKIETAAYYTATFALILIFIIIAFFPAVAFTLFGFRFYIISYTRSMEPLLEYNDLIAVQKFDFYKLEEGDIITFWSQTSAGQIAVTHEIVGIATNANGEVLLKTKGKNLAYPDIVPVSIDGANGTNTYIGKYAFKSEFWGNFIAFLKSTMGMICLMVNGAGLCVIWIVTGEYKPQQLEKL